MDPQAPVSEQAAGQEATYVDPEKPAQLGQPPAAESAPEQPPEQRSEQPPTAQLLQEQSVATAEQTVVTEGGQPSVEEVADPSAQLEPGKRKKDLRRRASNSSRSSRESRSLEDKMPGDPGKLGRPGDPGAIGKTLSGSSGTIDKTSSSSSAKSKAKSKAKAKANATAKTRGNGLPSADTNVSGKTEEKGGNETSANIGDPDAKKAIPSPKKEMRPFGSDNDVGLDENAPIEVADGKDGMNPCIFVFIAAGIALPNVILVEGLSQMGKGLEVYDYLAPRVFDMMASGIIAACAFLGCFLYVLDWANSGRAFQALTSIFIWCMLCLACVLKCRTYPAAPAVMLMFNVAVICGIVRRTFAWSMRRAAFYLMFTVLAFLTAAITLARWAAWISRGNDWNEDNILQWALAADVIYGEIYKDRSLDVSLDCDANRTARTEYFNSLGYTSDVKSEIGLACKKAHTVLFTVWANPLIAAVCGFTMAAFTLLNGVLISLQGSDDVEKLERLLKRFLGLVVLALMGMYLAVNVSGASLLLSSALMALSAAGLAATFVWTYMELGSTKLQDRVQKSKMTGMLLKAYHSDWGRAMLIGGFNVLLPCYLVLNMLSQKLNQKSGRAGLSDEEMRDIFTPVGRKLVNELKSWPWASILVKICLLGELFFVFQVGIAKATYIFLSWLNAKLASFSYAVVIIIIFFIGYTMFLLPPVPGVPVYVFCGIVVAEQGRKIESIGTVGGCVIACLLALVLKLAACTGQWGIGYALGKSVKIQQLIGVDKVPTRAIEKILSQPGLRVGKVAVLVGGPDWPTSVTCGILRLSIPQMLLGTAPVFIVASPCVLAGAFMARVVPGEDSIYNALAGVFLLASGIGQMGSGLMAVSCITKIVEEHGDELAKPRPEHEAVAALTRAEASMVRAHQEVTRWKSMGCMLKFTISLGAVLMLLSGFIFAMGGEYCFRTFAVSSDIEADYEDSGLQGKPLSIVLPPGWGAIFLFAVAVILHIIFSKVTSRMAKKRLEQGDSLEQGTPDSEVIGASLVENREEVLPKE